jgi:hypothetical protein
MEVARWLVEEVKPGVTGGDTWPWTDSVPYPDEPACDFCIHTYLQTRHGIINHENLALKQLADAEVYVFTYIFNPLSIVGATSYIRASIAIKYWSNGVSGYRVSLHVVEYMILNVSHFEIVN